MPRRSCCILVNRPLFSLVLLFSTHAFSQVRLGPNGVEEVLHYGTLSAAEQATLDAMIPDLVAQAKKGVEFVKASK